MANDHVDEDDVHDRDFEREIYPWHPENEHRNEEGPAADIEAEDIGVFHQRAAQFPETVGKRLRDLRMIPLAQRAAQLLHLGSPALLGAGVVGVESHDELAEELAAPRHGMKLLPQRLGILQFGACLALEEEEMELTVDVGHGSLLGMAHTGKDSEHPDGPLMGHEELRRIVLAKTDGYVDGYKPEVGADTVEDTPQPGILLRHASELSVGTVVGIGPHEQENADEVYPEIIVVESDAGAYADEDRSNGDGIGVNAEFAGYDGPCEPYGTIEN